VGLMIMKSIKAGVHSKSKREFKILGAVINSNMTMRDIPAFFSIVRILMAVPNSFLAKHW